MRRTLGKWHEVRRRVGSWMRARHRICLVDSQVVRIFGRRCGDENPKRADRLRGTVARMPDGRGRGACALLRWRGTQVHHRV